MKRISIVIYLLWLFSIQGLAEWSTPPATPPPSGADPADYMPAWYITWGDVENWNAAYSASGVTLEDVIARDEAVSDEVTVAYTADDLALFNSIFLSDIANFTGNGGALDQILINDGAGGVTWGEQPASAMPINTITVEMQNQVRFPAGIELAGTAIDSVLPDGAANQWLSSTGWQDFPDVSSSDTLDDVVSRGNTLAFKTIYFNSYPSTLTLGTVGDPVVAKCTPFFEHHVVTDSGGWAKYYSSNIGSGWDRCFQYAHWSYAGRFYNDDTTRDVQFVNNNYAIEVVAGDVRFAGNLTAAKVVTPSIENAAGVEISASAGPINIGDTSVFNGDSMGLRVDPVSGRTGFYRYEEQRYLFYHEYDSFEKYIFLEGRVGIGTDAPASTLHVDGALTLTPGTAPASPVEGTIYMDSTTHKLRCYDGTTWQDLW